MIGIIKRSYQNNVTNCYIMNLAVNDFLFLLTSVPLTAYLGVTKTWIFGDFICKMHIYFAHVCINLILYQIDFNHIKVFLQATCHTLAAMSIDRYLYMVHETWYRSYRKSKYAQIICLLIWAGNKIFLLFYHINCFLFNDSFSCFYVPICIFF